MDILMVLMGWLAHHITLLIRVHGETGKVLLPLEYVKTRPYKFALSIIGTIMGTILVVAQFETMTDPNDFVYLASLAGVGFACDGIADQLGKFAFKLK